MKQYLDVLQELVNKYQFGMRKADRTGTGTVSMFGRQLRFDLKEGSVPLLTTKKLHLKSIINELLWFISGSTNNNDLKERGVTIWNEWADQNGNLGPIYGKQWRSWPHYDIINSSEYGEDELLFEALERPVDQLQKAIDSIVQNPTSRRMIVTAWNPGVLPDSKLKPHENATAGKQCLPACHAFFQFNCEVISTIDRAKMLQNISASEVGEFEEILKKPENFLAEFLDMIGVPKYWLDCQVYVRSNDWFLGAPFNIAQYAILTHIIAALTKTAARELVYTTGDTHLYLNHIEQALEQLTRTPKEEKATIICNSDNWKTIDDVKYEDVTIIGYDPYPSIKAPVAV